MYQATRSRFGGRLPHRLTATGLAISLLLCASRAATAEPVTPEGIWYTEGDDSIIKMHACSDDPAAYCGTMVWLKEPNEGDGSKKIDKLNKDPAKNGKPLVGLDIFVGLKAESDHWAGKAYNPEDGEFYNITFKVKDGKEPNGQADLRGCLGSGMLTKYLCKTQSFNRATEVPGGDPTATADASMASAPAKKHKPKKDLRKDAAAAH